jgi:XTP/dITP diphosphohydrolase
MIRRFREPKLVLATHNAGKVREIGALMTPLGLEVVSAGALGLPEPVETENTFAGNARLKAHAAARASGLPALSDDSGIVIEALDGAPGVYTADWAETPSGRDYLMAMTRVWDMLEAKGAPLPRRASFNATLCLAWPDGHDEVFEGQVAGTLRWPPSGEFGFGFDPIFVPDGHDITFGDMDPDEKHKISHRAVAFARLLDDCLA